MIPKTYLIGITGVIKDNLYQYLRDTDQEDFIETYEQALSEGISEGEALVSFYAKLCYKSLVLGKNANVTRIRDIEDNLKSIVKTGHGSVFEHCHMNWITTNCSRIFTHELCRHRQNNYSQTSGRYVSLDKLDIIVPPELEGNQRIKDTVSYLENQLKEVRSELITDDMDFATKKKLTSAIRRIAPNGQTNEIGWTCNIRNLRHMIELRTSRHAEWEIRVVFDEVARIIEEKWPLMLWRPEGVGSKELVDGLWEYTGLQITGVSK